MIKTAEDKITQRERDELADKFLASIYNILFTNRLALEISARWLPLFTDTPLCRHKKKQIASKIKVRVDRYLYMIDDIIKAKRDFFSDAADIISDIVEDDVQVMLFSVKNEYDKGGCENSMILARMEVMRCIFSIATINLHKRIEEMSAFNCKAKKLEYLKMDDISKLVDELTDILYSEEPHINAIDLNMSDSCKRSVDALIIKLGDPNNIVKAINESDKLNPVEEDGDAA